MHLFNKENIWSNPCSFLHTSSHPDKYNNSVNRIISKEKEREDPRRDSSKTSFQLESKSVSSVSTRNPASYKLILYTELILQEIQENYNNYQAHSYAGLLQQLFPVYPSILHGRIKFQAPYSVPGLLQHKQASSNSTRQKQHSTWQPAYTQPFQQLPGAYHKEST